MKCLLLEDAPDAMEFLRDMLAEEFPALKIVGEAEDLPTARRMIEELKPDLVFFDIEMRDGSQSFELLKELREAGLLDFDIIFVTAYGRYDYVIRAMDHAAIAYLTKPVDREKLREAVGKVLANHQHREELLGRIGLFLHNISQPYSNNNHPIPVPLAKSVIETIQPEEIAWLESKSVYTDIHLQSGQVLHAMRNIGYFRDLLIPHLPFFQISQQAIIYLPFLRRFMPNEQAVVLKNGEQIHVSRKYGRQLRQHLQDPGHKSFMAELAELLKRWFRLRGF